ncbi:response regulator transcription factor [Clostridium sp. BJN0001]|uniref:response regulator transcription factor n=1 Tax=Clostridium sp. BJN0001 TaxID=2930219 RepID=UPI001FD00E18|nr:response regulator transcription factor [Clostridium sp. BJN0001]
MKANIAVVDDEKDIRNLISINLKNEGYTVFEAENGYKILEILEKAKIDLIILDIMMPKMDGMQACEKIREKSNVPILMLSAKSENMDKIEGLLKGADDYMVKPFDSLELAVKIKVMLRRAYIFNNSEKDENVINFGCINIDKSRYIVKVNGKEVKLTSKEFDILYLLSKNRGMIFSSEEIFEKVWKEKYFQANNTVMVHVCRLRDKLNKFSKGEDIIHTIWGVGYKIEK